MLRVFALLARFHQYPDTMGYGWQFEAIVRAWQPMPVSTTGKE
jgi:hypothetical protein